MADNVISQNTDFSSWDILYIEGLLMSSEEHATGPYPGPDESSPYPQTLS
jgi:hypothetical protein